MCRCLSIQSLQPMLQGAILTVPIAGKGPCPSVGRERPIISSSLRLASAADSCRPILMSSVNADGSPAYINAVFASVRLRPRREWELLGAAGTLLHSPDQGQARASCPGRVVPALGLLHGDCWPCCQEMAPAAAIGGTLPAQQRSSVCQPQPAGS